MRQSKRILERFSVDKNYVPTISSSALAEVQHEMKAYSAFVMQSGLATDSKGIYIDFADKFVRCGLEAISRREK
jgi:hypothetical protein